MCAAKIKASVLYGPKDLRLVCKAVDDLLSEENGSRSTDDQAKTHSIEQLSLADPLASQEERRLPAPEEDEVQVAIQSTGLCGSDVHYFHHFRNGDLLVRQPLTLGHESSGTVVAVGEEVIDLKPGDRVALEVGLPCEHCEYCEGGRYNICKDMRFRSSAKSYPHAQGTLQERINHPARWTHKYVSHVKRPS